MSHGKSSMKIGVDAVLLASWVNGNPKKILDVGTGCGVISLILAQRFNDCEILGIDIDEASVEEAITNMENSPWRENCHAEIAQFPDAPAIKGQKFDLIISNPPYFSSGIDCPHSPREKARHQGSLSVFSLLKESSPFLNAHGILAFIFPFEFLEDVKGYAKNFGWIAQRICRIRDNDGRPYKRVMMELKLNENNGSISQNWENVHELTLFSEGKPTEEYRILCHDFYLRF